MIEILNNYKFYIELPLPQIMLFHFRPEHPSDVKREYLFENTRNRSKWLRTKVAYRQPPEQKYKKFNLILGHVQRRIAKNRVEVIKYM